jgi:exodeoxyribonuclease V alpha subunit
MEHAVPTTGSPSHAADPLGSSERLLRTLDGWVEAGALRALDLAVTRFVAERGDERDAAVLLAVALTSERNGHGHVCLDLSGALAQPEALLGRLRDDEEISPVVRGALETRLQALRCPDWVERLAASSAVCDRLGGAPDDGVAPLVLAGRPERPLLYLRRYWQYENRIRDGIAARLARPIAIDAGALRSQLDALFPAPTEVEAVTPDWQRIACALAARSAFAIITGGPGTGKTTTVLRLLALLQGLAAAAGTPPLRVELAAPTGKAAARLSESLAGQVRGLPAEGIGSRAMPTQVKTLHRLLGTIPGSRHFRHQAANPLPADVIVVDEASMVDVEMMASLLEALRPEARLILLGDKDQLSSVEAGAVLGDLCRRAAAGHYRPETAAWLHAATGQMIPDALLDGAGTPLDQAIAALRRSYRFSEEGGIGALATLVNRPTPAAARGAGRLDAVQALFARDGSRAGDGLGTIAAVRLDGTADTALAELVREGYGGPSGYLTVMREAAPLATADQAALDAWAGQVLAAQKGFQVLTPLRQGPWGVEGLNQRFIEILSDARLLGTEVLPSDVAQRQWLAGRPVLVMRNDYGLGLMNGDIGVTLAVPAGSAPDGGAGARTALRVAFPSVDGGVRWVLPSRLQSVETVFAMTVHKSQGSEFHHTALILPDRPNPALTRELLYTAITRARSRFTLLYSDDGVLAEALERRVQRISGLEELLGT